ncbi:MAG: YlbF family regulator, partial [Verrucomicrobiota bacterium]
MSAVAEEPATESAYLEKLRALCQSLLDDEDLKKIFGAIDSFMGNEEAKDLFSEMQENFEELNTKQQAGLQLTAGEVEEYNKKRDAMLANPVAKEFLEARESMEGVQATVNTWV